MNGRVEIRLLDCGDFDLVMSAKGLFDFDPRGDQTRTFLESDREFLWFAMAGEVPVGFASASIVLHPDKPPHLFVNELATHDAYRRQGIATRLMQGVVAFGKSRNLWPVWLAAEGHDDAAQEFYRSLETASERNAIIFEWE